MAGIMANSATETMVAGDTSVDNTHAGYLTRETITLSVTGTPSTYLWSLATPTASGSNCALDDTDAASVTFSPDAEGYYVVTCLVDGTTLYVLRLAVVQISAVSTLSTVRLMPMTDVQVLTPPTGQTLFYSSDRAGLAVKDSTGTVDDVGGGGSGSGENFRATYYVDPTSTELPENGSQGAPYTTIAAAFADAVAAGYTGAIVLLPAGASITEANVTFPSGGGSWEIAGSGLGRTTLVSNITATSVTQSTYRLTNLTVTGTLTGVATSASGNFMWVVTSSISGAVSLTGSGSGFWWGNCVGSGTNFFGFGGSFGSTTSITGSMFAFNWYFTGAISDVTQVEWSNCRLPTSISVGGIGGNIVNCSPAAVSTITGVGGTISVNIDPITYKRFIDVGVTFVSVLVKTLNSNASNQRSVTANLGSTSFTGASGLVPSALYEAVYCAELITQGTAGTAVFEIRYTDLNGVAQTAAINATGLLVTAAVGTKSTGMLPFIPNGLTPITFSVSGITTPGSLSINLRIAFRRVD